MRILAIDTSNQTMTIAVSEDKKILGIHTTTIKKNHSLTLAPAITSLMKELELLPNDIDRIAVAYGPGSYTGLRIGVTTAKTLAYTLKKELVGISSLKVLAANCVTIQGIIIPVFNARRGYVYTGAYKNTDDGLVSVLSDRYILFEAWLQQLKEYSSVYFVGQDVNVFFPQVQSYLKDAHICQINHWQIPNAALLAHLGEVSEPVKNIHCFSPNYLKLVEAEENWLKDNGNRIEKYVEKS